jgi:photosystem II stability/assembly factor-like uncharacterized protein
VMFSYDEDVNTNHFFVASTNDAGVTWSYRRVRTPAVDQAGLSENVSLQFTDAQHGVMNIGIAVGSGPGVYPAVFVSTSDGGKSWKDLGGTGAGAGDMLFTTPTDGWMGSSSPADGFHVTRDGGRTWQEITLPRPAKVAPHQANVTYRLPIFLDKNHGFLTVEYSGSTIQAVGLFSTLDGGRKWKLDKVVSVSEASNKNALFTVVNSEWRTLGFASRELALSSLRSSSASSASVDANLAYLYSASFLDDLHGWALMGVHGDGPDQILSTSDAGASWTIITPSAN